MPFETDRLQRFQPHALAQFFAGMKRAEEISRDISCRQAALAPDARMRRFLMLQCRQEAIHARVFSAALTLTSRHDRCPDGLAAALARFASRLRADLNAGWLPGSLLGLQGVLESIGAVVLRTPRSELACFGAHFVPLRTMLLRQEETHHRYGRYWLTRLVANDDRMDAALLQSRDEYAELGYAVLTASVEIFDGFEVDQRTYRDAGHLAIQSVLDVELIGKAGP